MYGYIYKTTNNINNKIYVGQKKSDTFLEEKYLGSGTLLLVAVNKYGKDNFSVEMIDTAETQEELNDKEFYWVEHFDSMNSEVGYNLVPGGNRGGGALGTNWYTNGEDELLLFDYEKIPEGWVEGRVKNDAFDASSGKIWVNNGEDQTTIYPDELQLPEYVNYIEGMLDRGDLWRSHCGRYERTEEVIKNQSEARLKFLSENPDKRINNGTFKKGNKPVNTGKISITNGLTNKYIALEELPTWETLGWLKGSTQNHSSRRRKNA